jgi:hypothetical protein
MRSALPSGVHEIGAVAHPSLEMAPRGIGRALQKLVGDCARLAQQLLVVGEIREAQQRHAALARTEILAGAALQQILVRDPEAVAGLVDDLEALSRALGKRILIEEDAGKTASSRPKSGSRKKNG